MFTAPTVLPDDAAALQLILHAALAEIERLRLLIAGLQRNRFGRRSERLDDAAFQQGVENLEQSLAEQVARLDAASSAAAISTAEPTPRPPRTEPVKRNRGALPAHLARIEVVIDVDDKACPCCGDMLHVIGEDRVEMLDHVPAQLRVRVIRRPRYGCRACEEAVVQAPAPERPIDGGMETRRTGRMCWSTNMPTICRCIARRRSLPARVSHWIVPPCAPGWAAPVGGWRRCTNWC